MQRDEQLFQLNLNKEKEELQKQVNKLILDFEQKYYFEGVRLQLTFSKNQDEMNANGGRIKFTTVTGLYP